MTDAVVIIIPMLHRPWWVEPLLESIEATTPEPHRVIFGCTPDDEAVLAAVDAANADRVDVEYRRVGDYARKINAGYRASTEPLMFVGAGDLRFHPHWLKRAAARLAPGIGVVGTNDLGNPRVLAGEHATHCLVTRAYADQFGIIDAPGQVLYEGYPHEYVDDELVGTAKKRDAWAFAGDSIVEHLHPHWGKGPTDELYEAQRARMRDGRNTYLRRRRLWT